MGDMRESFDLMKELSKKRKANNLDLSTKMLESKGIEFVVKNGGVHLIVTGKDSLIDFWPSTGKFKCRNKPKPGRGVFNLLKHC